MPDLLTMKIKKSGATKIKTFICADCELEFIVYADLPRPKICPYCSSENIDLNDSHIIQLWKRPIDWKRQEEIRKWKDVVW